VYGEEEEPGELPTLDYPGGTNTSFVTSQATAEKRDKSKYEDAQRIQESMNRKVKDVGASERNKAEQKKRNSTDDSHASTKDQSGHHHHHHHSGKGGQSMMRRKLVLSNAELPVTYSDSSYLGQFLSFTTPVPWPFANITRVMESFLHEHRHNITDVTARMLKEKIEYVADTGAGPKMNSKDDKSQPNGQQDTWHSTRTLINRTQAYAHLSCPLLLLYAFF